MTPDVLIVGGGLAGSALAWACLDRGARVRVVDRGDAHSASRVAAGLVTPLTGHRLAVSWRLGELYPAALDFYRRVESASGIAIFDTNSTVRVMCTTAEAEFVAKRADAFTEYLSPVVPALDADAFSTPFGAVEMCPAGRLDVPAFLHAVRDRLGAGHVVGEVDLHDPPVAGRVAFCHGYAPNPHFPGLQFRPTKGEVLTLRVSGVTETRTVNRNGTWLYPLGDELFLAGSTYDHDDLTATPTAAGRARILESVAGFVRRPVEVVGHRAGVRPILDASRPVLAASPTRPGLVYFNGLGSKGALTAPFFAQHLADHVLAGVPLDPVVGRG